MRICDYFMSNSSVGSFKPKEMRIEKVIKWSSRCCFAGGRKGKTF